MPRPLFQFPNPPLLLAMAARGASLTLGDRAGRTARTVSDLALLDWAYLEVTDGANWLRRLIGLGGVAVSVAGLTTKL